MSAVAIQNGVIVFAAHWKYVVTNKDYMTKSGCALFTGVCVKIDINISILCSSDFCWLSAVAI